MAVSLSVEGSTIKEDYYDNPVEKRAFDDKVWEAAKGEIDYTPAEIKKKREEEAATANSGTNNGSSGSRNNRSRSYGNWNIDIGSGVWSAFFKLLLIILGVVLISMLVFRLAGGSFEVAATEKKIKGRDFAGNVDIKKVEENLHKSDMEILIDQSLAKGEYMMAVRLHYLWAIKELSNKRLIKWKRDKTNRDYIREMRKTDLNKSFREVTRIFERVWYGTQDTLKQTDYLPIQQKLDAFIKQVKKK
ncbi:MAG: hypothetical protein ACI94Y_003948 [Maribacter sp.]|jgi:hypothetical protein